MIRSEQTNKLTLICDICGKEKVYLDESAYELTGNPIFGEKGNYEYAKIKDGWMIRNHHCRCSKCKGKKVTKGDEK